MTEILIYGIVGDWWDGLDAGTLVPAIAAGDDDLDIRINSPGGYVMEGLAIYNAIVREGEKGRKVTIHIDGLAASMGSLIAMAAADIVMAEGSLMMIHNPWDCACGDAAELRRAADQLDKIRGVMVGIYSKRSGVAVDDLIPLMDDETWLTPDEAVAQGFATSVSGQASAQACNIKPFGFRKAPASPRLTMVGMARPSRTAAAAHTPPQEKDMPNPANPAANPTPTPTPTPTSTETSMVALTAADVAAAVSAERERVSGIQALGRAHKMQAEFVEELVAGGASLADARAKILDKLAEASDATPVGHSRAVVTLDAREKWLEGAANWLMVKAGVDGIVESAARARGETLRIDPGEFRGMRNADLAREALGNMGVACGHRDPDLIVRAALSATPTAPIKVPMGMGGAQTIGDFPVLFEVVVHKVLQAAYAITPDTWSRFCGKGTVTDFREHNRYLRGTFGALDEVNELGEFKNKAIPDGAKEKIAAKTKGNIIALSRQAIVNDDLDIFSGLAVDLGRAAKLTVEKDVYALLASNPNMNDGYALFETAHHKNLAASGAAPSVAAFDAMRVEMAKQMDLSGNEILDIRPAVGLFPIGLGSTAKILIGAQYDPDAVNKLQKPNAVQGLLRDIVDTPRLSGTAYYFFADPNFAPAIEVVFLNGVMEPFTDSQEGWRVDGVEWKVRHDYGVGAVNWRCAYKQPGA